MAFKIGGLKLGGGSKEAKAKPAAASGGPLGGALPLIGRKPLRAQMQKLGSGATFYNVSFVGSKALADALGKDGVGVAISQVVPFPWATGIPVVKEYQVASKKAGFTDYNFSALEGFITAKVMALRPRVFSSNRSLRYSGTDRAREP